MIFDVHVVQVDLHLLKVAYPCFRYFHLVIQQIPNFLSLNGYAHVSNLSMEGAILNCLPVVQFWCYLVIEKTNTRNLAHIELLCSGSNYISKGCTFSALILYYCWRGRDRIGGCVLSCGMK